MLETFDIATGNAQCSTYSLGIGLVLGVEVKEMSQKKNDRNVGREG